MLCHMVSYERGQILRFRFNEIHSFGSSREAIDNGFRPNRLSRAPGSVIARWWWCLAAYHGACEFSCVAVVQIGGGHVRPHECRPYADRWIASRERRAW